MSPRKQSSREPAASKRPDFGKLLLHAATESARRAGAGPDVANDAVLAALEHQRKNPRATDDELLALAERRARNLGSEQRKKERRETNEARSGIAVDTRPDGVDWGCRKARPRAEHEQLKSKVQRALASELEAHERELRWSFRSGLLLRGSSLRDGSLDKIEPLDQRERRRAECASADRHERGSYECIFGCIARHAGLQLDTQALVEQMIAFRERELAVRCEICSPGSRGILCEHTLPRFEGGKQVGGVDLRGRGRRSLRTNHQFKFGTNVDDVPYSNYNSRYLEEDAAGRIVTEALRLAGVDPTVKHVLERQREQKEWRKIRAFMKGWERGPDGQMRPKPQRQRSRRSARDDSANVEEK